MIEQQPNAQAIWTLYAPSNCKVWPIEKHPSATVAAGHYGKGVSFLPKNEVICSPIDGTLIYMSPTFDCLRIKHTSGLLVHFGFANGVENMMTAGFKKLYPEEQKLECGQPIFSFHMNKTQAACDSLWSFISLVNLPDNYQFKFFQGLAQAKIDPIIEVFKPNSQQESEESR
ncbi:PTS glucose transporter subunit IIA [Catenovulum sediminis]|uniref:PTS glucose transporter subunit IIA n=1 Tax=Catenovulum sediminis TaxID=1740262 RepID=UPI0011805E7A|nr:PTS glucose transporter subunit IIA [Catenovulum sediminis]